MERNREIRRASTATATAAVNGFTKRRHRITSLRDSPDEDRDHSLQKKKISYSDRDRELMNRKKRRTVERYGSLDEEESTDESFDEEEEDDRRIHRNRTSPSTSSISNHSHRRSFTPARFAARSPSATDESVIGVAVPRKARSSSVKRSHENWSFGNGDRRYSPSSVMVGRCLDGASPSSSSGSLKKKKRKKKTKSKTRLPKIVSAIQDDIEIEVAEALFDLMKQSHSENSKNQEMSSNVNSSEKLDSGSDKAVDDKSVCSPMTSEQATAKASDLAHARRAQSMRFLQIAGSVEGAHDGSTIETKADNEQDSNLEMESSVVKSENVSPETIMGERRELKKEESVGKEKESTKRDEEMISGDGDMTQEEVVARKEEESRSCAKSKADNNMDSTSSKEIMPAKVTETTREAKFDIDLMASPPMPSSPERNGVMDMASDHPQLVKSEMVNKNEDKMLSEAPGKKKMETVSVQKGVSRVGLEMPFEENADSSSDNKPQEQGKKVPNECKAPIPGGQKFAQASSLPFPIAGAGWPTGLPHPGYMPPLQMVMPVDGSARSLTALQPPPFVFSRPRPKRCATHQNIARSINLHQQLTKNYMWPAAAGPATLYGAKPYNFNPVLSAQNVITGSTSRRDFPGRQTLAMVPGLSGKDKSSGAANSVDATKGKQLMLQQAPQQVPTANVLHGPALIFQLGQQHASMAPPANQPGPPKSATALANAGTPSNSAGAPVSSSSLPAGAAAVNFNHANAVPPYMAIFQNNGYPFSFSPNIAVPPPAKGGVQAPSLPLFNGSYYSSPMFHVSQNQQQQSRSQPQVQTSSHNTSTSSGTKPTQAQPYSQPQMGAQVSCSTNFPPTTMLLQQSQKQQAPSSHSAGKPTAEASQKDNGPVADIRTSHSQKSNNGQNFAIPFQPMNFAYMAPGTFGGGMGTASSNHGEQQQQGSRGGVEFMSPQAFALSMSSTASTTPALNFSIAQNPAVLQMLPDMNCKYQFAPGTQMTQQHRNFQISEGKIAAGSNSNGEERKGILGKSPMSAAQSLNVFDSSGHTVSFVQSPISGNQAFPSSSTVLTTVASANMSNSQQQHQQQLIHLQKQHMQQMQRRGTDQLKEPKSNAFPFSSAQSSHLKNLASSQVSLPFNASSLKDLSQQQWNNPQGQNHIAFGSGSNLYTAFQGQPFVIHNQSAASLVGESPSNHSISKDTGGASKTASTGNKNGPTSAALPSQQIETSRSTPSQKSSPVCGRNVPSILSTSPSQLSKLKH